MEKLKAFLQTVRPCGAGPSRLRFAGWCALLLCAGLAAGVGIKLLDIFTQNPGNLFSQLSVWIFLCTLIAAGSRSPLRAGAYVFLFAAGMLASYYLTAHLTGSVYGVAFIYGWSAFACLTPLFAFAAWYGKGRGWPARLVAIGIPACMLLCAAILFDRVRLPDLLLAVLTLLYLRWPVRKIHKKEM